MLGGCQAAVPHTCRHPSLSALPPKAAHCGAPLSVPCPAAGSAALPRAFVLLGLLLAGGFLLLMGYMTREQPATPAMHCSRPICCLDALQWLPCLQVHLL